MGIPACCEEERIVRCLRSVLNSCDAVASEAQALVTVAADRCDDRTAELVRGFMRFDPRVDLLEGSWGSAGSARRAALEHGLSHALAMSRTTEAVWLATTDADTVVPVTWLQQQLQFARNGVEAVAGVVDLLADADRSSERAEAFASSYPVGLDTHTHVHAANMGIRADSYLRAGGFPELEVGEDRALWDALGATGANRHAAASLAVFTSARLAGPTHGAFSDALRNRLSAFRSRRGRV
ncbi:MAG: glycosyltransferase [Actinobacteria bacterium]|nr:glycosyltransferase [Actinomycetota bacterium]